jgi:cell division septum initiation protein DivIVA
MQIGNEDIQRIEEKVSLLLKEYTFAQKEIQRLQKENTALQKQLETHTQKTSELNQTIDVLKINALTSNDSSKKDLEKRINTYLREIDKCLSLLQS